VGVVGLGFLNGKVPFRYQHGRGGINHVLRDASACAGRSCVLEYTFRLYGRIAFIHRVDWQAVTPKFFDEGLDRFLHLAARTIRMGGHADDQLRWFPFAQDGINSIVVDALIAVGDGAQGAGRTRHILSDRHADATQTEVKTNNRAGS